MLEIRNLVIFSPYKRIILYIFVKVNIYFKGVYCMYHCKDCGFEFLYADTIIERHTLDSPPFEKIRVCPNCKSYNFDKAKTPHCRCCGRRLKSAELEYCSKECKIRGEFMWREQSRRRQLYENSSLVSIVRQLELYNKQHKTHYTYGNFVGKILKEHI